MRPDFWLSQTDTDKYVLTPSSGLGKLAFPGLELGRNIGTGLVLTESESVFIAQVLEDSHYKVSRHDHQGRRSIKTERCKVIDTRPKPRARGAMPQFTKSSDRLRHITESTFTCISDETYRRFSLEAHAHLLQPL